MHYNQHLCRRLAMIMMVIPFFMIVNVELDLSNTNLDQTLILKLHTDGGANWFESHLFEITPLPIRVGFTMDEITGNLLFEEIVSDVE